MALNQPITPPNSDYKDVRSRRPAVIHQRCKSLCAFLTGAQHGPDDRAPGRQRPRRAAAPCHVRITTPMDALAQNDRDASPHLTLDEATTTRKEPMESSSNAEALTGHLGKG